MTTAITHTQPLMPVVYLPHGGGPCPDAGPGPPKPYRLFAELRGVAKARGYTAD